MRKFSGPVFLLACLAAQAQTPAPSPKRQWSLDQLQRLNTQAISVTTLGDEVLTQRKKGRDKPMVKFNDDDLELFKLAADAETSSPLAMVRRPDSPEQFEAAAPSIKVMASLAAWFKPGRSPGELFSPEMEQRRALQGKFAAVQEKFETYNRAYVSAVRQPEQGRATLVAAGQELSASVASAFSTAASLPAGGGSTDSLRLLLALEHVHSVEQKSVYGARSNYQLTRYTRLLANAGSVGRIDLPDKSIASCVLIGDHLIATAAHAVEALSADRFRVVFFTPDAAGGTKASKYKRKGPPVMLRPPVAIAGLAAKLDLALLEIEPDAPGDDPVAGMTPAGLYDGDVGLDGGVYVLGYPELPAGGFSPLVVHDACFAIYPHRARAAELEQLQLRAVQGRLVTLLSLAQGVDGLRAVTDAQLRAMVDAEITAFRQLYVPVPAPDSDRLYVLPPFSPDPDPVPVFGLDADASRGDSGGGVFSKDMEKGSLVGIFVSGLPGANTPYVANLNQHEHAIPSSVIARILRADYPAAVAKYRIQFVPVFSP